jgi:hypothetical protein
MSRIEPPLLCAAIRRNSGALPHQISTSSVPFQLLEREDEVTLSGSEKPRSDMRLMD